MPHKTFGHARHLCTCDRQDPVAPCSTTNPRRLNTANSGPDHTRDPTETIPERLSLMTTVCSSSADVRAILL